jgi:hypothetical protein
MSQVWERQVSGTRLAILLCLADFARDDGSKCFPAIATIAYKVGRKDREVQYVLKKFRELGVLVTVRQGTGRGRTTHYRINLEALPPKGPPPALDEGD